MDMRLRMPRGWDPVAADRTWLRSVIPGRDPPDGALVGGRPAIRSRTKSPASRCSSVSTVSPRSLGHAAPPIEHELANGDISGYRCRIRVWRLHTLTMPDVPVVYRSQVQIGRQRNVWQ